MINLKISNYLKKNGKMKLNKKERRSTELTPYVKPYNVGDVICTVGFYFIKNEEKRIITIKEMEKLFKLRKIRCIDVKFDVRHLIVSEEYEYGETKHGFIAFNDKVSPTLIAVNRYPEFNPDFTESYIWKFIKLEEYFKENPITNLEYIDYKYASSVMSENDFIPNRVCKSMTVVVNNYIGTLDGSVFNR